MLRFSSFLLRAAALGAFVVVTATPAFAHGERGVGDMKWVVGWATEPPFAGQLNAVELRLTHDGKPVQGAQDTLKVAIALGGGPSRELDLEPAFEDPGRYTASILPTAPGDYTFRFTGKVDGEDVNQSFTASKDGFDVVKGSDEVAFPGQAPTTTQLARRIVGVDAAAADAKSATKLPLIVSIVALVAGVISLLRPRRA